MVGNAWEEMSQLQIYGTMQTHLRGLKICAVLWSISVSEQQILKLNLRSEQSKGRLPHAHRLTNRAARVRIHFGRCNASSSKDVFEETHPERLGSIKHCLGETHSITHSTQLSSRTGEGYSRHH